jgi:GT2 family glycosyltransferase
VIETGHEVGLHGPGDRLAVVVVNYGSSSLLERNLVPLADACPNTVVVVVDNFSSTSERRVLRDLATRRAWHILEQDNVGFGGGVNAGVRHALSNGCDHVLILNPDAVIDRDNLITLESAWRDRPDALVAPRIERPDGSSWFSGASLDLRRGRTMSRPHRRGSPEECEWLTAACLMVGSTTWRALDGFDESYFLYWEDVDLSYRALAIGAPLVLCPEAVAIHDEGGTQEPSTGNAMSWDYYYFNIRNRLLFATKNLPADARREWKRHTLRESYRILLRGDGKRKFLRPWRPMSTLVRGIRDGLAAT